MARGIDALNVDLVICIDIPFDPETYLHRIGIYFFIILFNCEK